MPDLQDITGLFRSWPLGVDSWTSPNVVSPRGYVWAQNILNKGGIPQTRPGSRSLACMPRGFAQGCKLFTPRNDVAHLVAAVDGRIWVAPAPFTEWRQLVNLQFNPVSPFITITIALKSTDYDAAGELFFLDEPYKVAMIQDGSTRAAFWDGSVSAHLNPTPSNAELTVPGRDGTKIGLWSIYSNNRYWIARGRFVFASDIGNPLKFHESQYINESPAFVLPDNCTGMIEVNDQSGIICFYQTGGDFIETSIQDRTQWLDNSNIQRSVLELGCIAPRSIIKLNGLIHWFSPKGFVPINEALRANLDSTLDTLDDPMAYSKHRIGPDLTRICAGTFGEIGLVSVPFCSLKNTHTWIYDQAIIEREHSPAWASVWTGWRPVEWTSGLVDDYERIFFLSSDSDGNNRVWEAFTADRKDNGCDITCSVQLRQEEFERPDVLKRFKFAEVQLGQIAGTIDVMTAVASSRGWFEKLNALELIADYERCVPDQIYGDGITLPLIADARKQSRIFRTPEWDTVSECNKCGIEGVIPLNVDYGFTFFIGWSGRAALTRIKLFAVEETENDDRGDCPQDESGEHLIDIGGCGFEQLNPVNVPKPFPRYFATALVEGLDIIGRQIAWESSGFSDISQKDADRRANCKAFQQVLLNAQSAITIPILVIYDEAGENIVTALDFGSFFSDETGEITLRLVNEGDGTLEIESASIIAGVDNFQIVDGPDQIVLEPNEFTFLTIRFTAPNVDTVLLI